MGRILPEGLGDLLMLSPVQAKALVKDQLFPGWEAEKKHLDWIDLWCRWKQEEIRLPRKATPELRQLAKLSTQPWLSLVVTAVTQAMYVDGYRSKLDPAGQSEEARERVSAPWRTWLANRMDLRQIAIHRATLGYGYSFGTVLPGVDPMTGARQSVIRGLSPRKAFAVWEDPAEDDWPQYVMRVVDSKNDRHVVRLFDDTAVHSLTVEGTGSKVEYQGSPEIHEAGVCPVVRYANMLDLEGRATGEVEPYIAAAARINKTSYDGMLTQHFTSWKVRTVAGMAPPEDGNVERKKVELSQAEILVAEDPDTKFGTLAETPLTGFIEAHRHDVETLAALSQTPTHELTGQLANLSAEALAAARASLNQKVVERQKSIGASHAQALRLAAALDGDDEHATDLTGRVTWQDMEIRSMSQAVDALGKAATMLFIPPSALWSRIPGVEKSDVEEWIELAEKGDPITKLQADLARQVAPSQGDTLQIGRAAGGDGSD